MPKLAGTYTSEMTIDMGSGQTHQEQVQKLGWFAIYLDDDKVVARALDGNGLPTIVARVLPIREFFAEFTPDNAHYAQKILPLLESIHAKLGSGGTIKDLDKGEAAVFRAMVLESEHLPGQPKENRQRTALKMLSNLPDQGVVEQEHKHKLSAESVSSRKDGQYDEAIDLYGAMLRIAPDDDHIFFNVARVYFEKGDFVSCRKYLLLALEHDPNFEEASKFLAYLDKRVGKNGDKRMPLRYRFHQPQPCTVSIGKRELAAYVADVSECGARLRLAPDSKAQLADGLDVTVRGISEVVAPLLDDAHGKTVWHTSTTCGVAFAVSLDHTADEFRGIIAHSRLV